ncbi:unnamed protein product (macronuclear) [Paramecium tetraurelia]|uniref:Uncharacterized protein n=1 Tax=Paramecium tetraurelia TaxID=5888 RepID=A0CDJ8_PARTE|nr:uncharacterized protein GSPATT00007076001 [Paramecium tetraurelia]CAK68865.1 unnamed protein product [Paramecium tetraurelia]|eukprot:XP_001436262.1 hypothetical protein (macronuclear) [Paramecium tetraurelia strain d4-2]
MFDEYNEDQGFVDQPHQREEYEDSYLYRGIDQYCHLTEIPKLNTKVQVDRYNTLMEQDADTKNIPKTFGNNFKKFMDNQLQLSKDYFFKNPIPKEMVTFLNKKKTGKQADYTIQDFRELFQNKQSNAWFQFYIENFSFLDLVNSNRIDDPEKYIKFIEQYLAGARDPSNFISSRPIKNSKQEKKKQKREERIEVQSIHQGYVLPQIIEEEQDQAQHQHQNDYEESNQILINYGREVGQNPYQD